jgi:hypothetical protein
MATDVVYFRMLDMPKARAEWLEKYPGHSGHIALRRMGFSTANFTPKKGWSMSAEEYTFFLLKYS